MLSKFCLEARDYKGLEAEGVEEVGQKVFEVQHQRHFTSQELQQQ